MTVVYRPMRADDCKFVISAWSSSLRNSDRAGMIAMKRWAAVMHVEIEEALDRPHAITVVAQDTETDLLLGFISADVSQGLPYVLYVYVKEPHRRSGIARGLFAAIGVDPTKPFSYACRTTIVGWLRSKIPHARHDHLRVRFPETSGADR